MKTAIITFTLVLGLAGIMHIEASEGPDLSADGPGGRVSGQSQGNVEEEWYFEFSMGSSAITFPEFVNEEVTAAEVANGPFSAGSMDYEMGVYWPVDDERNDLIGFVVSGVSTTYTPVDVDYDPQTGEARTVQADASFLGLSYMRFFGEQVGEGFFLRGDVSFLGSYVSVSNDFDQTETMLDGTFAGLLGTGYGWIPSGWDTRILLYCRYHSVVLEDDRSSAYSIGVTFLY
ncbi:hypothetical protein ACFL4W_03990 [Planctomycetota bacterium]